MTAPLTGLLTAAFAVLATPALAGTGGPWEWGQTGLLVLVVILLWTILQRCKKS